MLTHAPTPLNTQPRRETDAAALNRRQTLPPVEGLLALSNSHCMQQTLAANHWAAHVAGGVSGWPLSATHAAPGVPVRELRGTSATPCTCEVAAWHIRLLLLLLGLCRLLLLQVCLLCWLLRSRVLHATVTGR